MGRRQVGIHTAPRDPPGQEKPRPRDKLDFSREAGPSGNCESPDAPAPIRDTATDQMSHPRFTRSAGWCTRGTHG
jgi:hypothetical protein